MPERYFALNSRDKNDLLEMAADRSGRSPHILEKDIWVVWVLSSLFHSKLGPDLTFKGGTSLSKAYKVIDRFSEDIDVTYDIRRLIGDLLENSGEIPRSASQAKKWTKAVRERLPLWVESNVIPVLSRAMSEEGIKAELSIFGEEKDSLLLSYAPMKIGTGYVTPQIRLEFGARATGEPREPIFVGCDLAMLFPDIVLPEATPLVMKMERTFWEKITAAHVFCLQSRLKGERFSRHWHDIAKLAKSSRMEGSFPARQYGEQVVAHKSMFFVEKDQSGASIDYAECLRGQLRLVPTGTAYEALAEDYAKMAEDGILLQNPQNFQTLLGECAEIEQRLNRALVQKS
jgi:hypothetical protein